ncbi:galactose mutarotase-like protein [Meredithblackwellia eburnea MCA 4105]
MWVKGRDGEARDIVLGYDDRVQYASDPNFAYFGSVVGRYANRIRNSTFAIPPQQVISHAPKDTVHRVTPNENGGRDTLHGGKLGYSRSGFCVLRHSKSKLVFGIVDRDGSEGFPGTVSALVKYELKEGGRWLISMQARVKGGETPVMLTSHTYWNLDGYQDSQTALDHTLFVKSSKFIETDGILIPTGEIGKINLGSPMDFNTPNIIGSRIKDTSGLCGTGCTGYDTCFLYDENDGKDVVMELSSKLSGIKLSVRTNQPAAQVYSCNGQNGVTPRKFSQGGPKETYGKYSCVVLEQQGWIDAINNPQWGQDQIYGSAGREVYKWESEYTFTTM